jgi:hypothetical protein
VPAYPPYPYPYYSHPVFDEESDGERRSTERAHPPAPSRVVPRLPREPKLPPRLP